jgi:hypothetical protein
MLIRKLPPFLMLDGPEAAGSAAPAAPAAPQPPAPAAPAPAQPAEPAAPAPNPAEKVEDLPEWAQKAIREARKEAGDHRVAARTAAEEAQKALTDKLAVALGLKPDAATDPAALTASLTQAQQSALQAARELAVFKAASTAGADPSKLLDRASFLTSIAGIDPSDGAAIKTAIDAAVAADQTLKAARAAGASTVDTPGGPGEQGQITEASTSSSRRSGAHCSSSRSASARLQRVHQPRLRGRDRRGGRHRPHHVDRPPDHRQLRARNVTVITPERSQDAQRTLVVDQSKFFAVKVDDVDKRQAKGNVIPQRWTRPRSARRRRRPVHRVVLHSIQSGEPARLDHASTPRRPRPTRTTRCSCR